MLVEWIAGELMPRQGQLDQPLPVGTFGLRGPLHCGLGFVLWIVLGAHEADASRPSGQARGNFIRMIAGYFRGLVERSVNYVTACPRHLR